MIKITLLSGRFAGITRVIPENQDPGEFIGSIFAHGWKWEIDYSQANEDEKLAWFKEDMSARCVRAIVSGLPVRFLDKIFQEKTGDLEKRKTIVGELEDAIVESGRMVSIEQDNEDGVIISVQGFAH